MPDNYELWEAHEAKQEAWLSKRPVCCHCGHPIQDERLWAINGDLYHTHCAELYYCMWTEDYIE